LRWFGDTTAGRGRLWYKLHLRDSPSVANIDVGQYFFDTSALVKRYHKEDGTEQVGDMFAPTENLVRISTLGVVEIPPSQSKLTYQPPDRTYRNPAPYVKAVRPEGRLEYRQPAWSYSISALSY